MIAAENAASWDAAEHCEGMWWYRFSRSLGEKWEAYWQGQVTQEWETTQSKWQGFHPSMGPSIATSLVEHLAGAPKLSGTVV